jgi:DNA-binding SARP family transcriptional activator/tetratricopeptide (TPR) repeat protein
MDGVLDSLSVTERDGLCQLAHLPYLSRDLAASLTGLDDMLERILAAGVPLLPTAAGLWEMPGPVTDYLATLVPLSPSAASIAASILRSESQLMAALRMLMESGHSEQAAGLVADLTPAEAEELGWAEIRNIVEALPAAEVRRRPQMLVHLARTAETPDRMALRRDALTRASQMLDDDSALSDKTRREIRAEQARDLVWDERTRDEARELAVSVIEQSDDDEVARARALDALGRLGSWWSKDGPHDDAGELLEESARLSLRFGQPEWAARTLFPLAMGLHFGSCRYGRALDAIDRSLTLLPARSQIRVFALSFRNTVLCELGRFAEAEASLAELRDVTRSLGEEWVEAYASWSEAELASMSADRRRTERAVFDALQHRAGWFDETPGIEFLAQTADMLDRVGNHDLANDQLRRARESMEGFERVVYVYGAAVSGRSGDPVLAEEAISQTLARGDLDPQERWPLVLLRAYAAYRRNDPETTRLAAVAFEGCLELGLGDAPVRRERAACEVLLPLAAAAGCTAAASLLESASKVSITLLGGFEVRRGGHVLRPPAGRPEMAIRVVAAAGGRVHAEELIAILWPDAGTDAGRNRLKNLLSRLRSAIGDVLVRDNDTVALASGSQADADDFEIEARQALRSLASGERLTAVRLARSAVERYRGDLLPTDLYATWAAEPRERVRLEYLEMLDLLAAWAEDSDEIDEAVRLTRRAIGAERYDERRYVKLANLLASQGRAGSARSVLRNARAVLDDLDLTPSAGLLAMEQALGMP